MQLFSVCLFGVLLVVARATDPPELEGEDGLKKVTDAHERALVMYYAPWCPHCQEAKPKFKEAFTKLKDKTRTLAYVNCENAKNSALCTKEKIEGYPTMKFYQKGKDTMNYEQDVTADAVLGFMENPVASASPAGGAGSEPAAPEIPMPGVKYLVGAEEFKAELTKTPHSMVFFYAPWCPHCQDAKPKYAKAAEELKKQGLKDRGLFAVNCDVAQNQAFCTQEKVEGFPTVRYYNKAEMFAEYEDEIDSDPILKMLKDPPKEKVPPTPVEDDKSGAKPAATPDATADPNLKEGEKQLTDADRQPEKPEDLMKGVTYVTGANIKDTVAKYPNALVMYYAPWCPHCQEAKPVFQAAHEELTKKGVKFLLAAINCDAKENEKHCEEEKVDGFPTLLYYHAGKRVKVYEEGPPTIAGIVKFLTNPPVPKEEL